MTYQEHITETIATCIKKREKGIAFEHLPVTDDDVKAFCENKNLLNVCLEYTHISDTALEYLATLPKLKYLFLVDAKITGSGFKHFENHPKLDCLWVKDTQVDDKALNFLAHSLPKLKTLLIDGTKITFDGMMKAAANKKLDIVSHTQFTPEQMAAYKAEQRRLAKTQKPVTPDDAEECKALLLEFFKAIGQWEKFAAEHFDIIKDGVQQKWFDLCQTYCTDKNHQKWRGSWSLMEEGSYGSYKLVDVEQISKNKLHIYTTDIHNFEYRFLFIRTENGWKIDAAQRKDGTWTKEFL